MDTKLHAQAAYYERESRFSLSQSKVREKRSVSVKEELRALTQRIKESKKSMVGDEKSLLVKSINCNINEIIRKQAQEDNSQVHQ